MIKMFDKNGNLMKHLRQSKAKTERKNKINSETQDFNNKLLYNARYNKSKTLRKAYIKDTNAYNY